MLLNYLARAVGGKMYILNSDFSLGLLIATSFFGRNGPSSYTDFTQLRDPRSGGWRNDWNTPGSYDSGYANIIDLITNYNCCIGKESLEGRMQNYTLPCRPKTEAFACN